ncbi:MAG TPA: HD domain-containing protein [Acidimicrobiales bacterium]|nr:HD domain-containing protein [Acidimicrobiales bacterium]
MCAVLLDAIDHVQLAMPPGGEELATWFYEGALGVPRVPKPPHLAVRGGCWFERGALRIHVGVQEDFTPATKAHPAFTVTDLDRLEADLTSRGLPVRREEDPLGPDVLYVDDPFGNRIELRPERGVADRAPYTEVIEDVAREAVGDRLADSLAFVAELDRLKTVERQSLILDGLRREDSAEHCWHVAMLAVVLAEHAPDDVDLARVVLLLLVHDIVEIDAGDTGIYDDQGAASKEEREREAADRLFGLLPADVGARLREAWEEYEHGDTPAARFARVFDRLAPFLLNLGAGGIAWRRWGVDATRVRSVLSAVGAGAPELGRFVDAMLDRAVDDGLLPRGGSGLILP